MKALILTLSLLALPGLTSTACATAGHGGTTARAAKAPSSFAQKPPAGTRAFCPVMKHDFTVKADSKFSVYQGRYYVFCCPPCKPKFDADPAKYAGR